MNKFAKMTLVLVGLFSFPATVQAFETLKPSTLQLRQGPGNHYAKSGQIAAGQSVQIGVCNPSWCHVRAGQKAGWVPTAKINPALARMNNNASHHQASVRSASGGGGFSSGRGQMQASTTMTISMEIVAKDGSRAKNQASILPYPIPAHRRISSR